MTIIFNGNPKEIKEGQTVSSFLKTMGYQEKKVSVWIDGRQLLYSEYAEQIPMGCSIRVMRILGGG